MRRNLFAVMAVALALAACQTAPQEPPSGPPTDAEKRVLGPDAYDDYFLTRWRKCVQWNSEGQCWIQLYGGDGGIP